MRKRIKTRKFSRTTNERKQLFRNLMRSLVLKGYVVTSAAKAKAVRPIVEKLVTKAKAQSLASFRKLLKETGNVETARGFKELGSLFLQRPGGYLRLIKLGTQVGDNTQLVRLEWVEKFTPAETISQPKIKPEAKDKLAKTKTVSKKPVTKSKTKGTKK